MKFYSYCLLLSATVISFASELPKNSSVKKSLLTLAIEAAQANGTFGKENATVESLSPSQTITANTSISSTCSTKLSVSGRYVDHIASPLANVLNRKQLKTGTLTQEQLAKLANDDEHDIAMNQLLIEQKFQASKKHF